MSSALHARFPRAATLAVLLAIAVGSVSPALGQFSPKDQKVLDEYRLTLPTLSKFGQATENYITALKADPSLVKQFKDQGPEQSQEEAGTPVLSIEGIVAKFERLPVLRRAITSAGLTPKEYVTFNLAAAFANVAKELGSTNSSAVERDNIVFLKKTEAEMARLNELTMWLEQTN